MRCWVVICDSADVGVLVVCLVVLFDIAYDVLTCECSVNVVVWCCVGRVIGVGQQKFG